VDLVDHGIMDAESVIPHNRTPLTGFPDMTFGAIARGSFNLVDPADIG